MRFPNIIRGGQAIPLGDDYYFMHGKKHSQGGIDIGNNLEVEGGEVMKMGKKNIKVYSSVPILGGISPAQMLMMGGNPSKVFNAQERFKIRNKIKDDGTKARFGIATEYDRLAQNQNKRIYNLNGQLKYR